MSSTGKFSKELQEEGSWFGENSLGGWELEEEIDSRACIDDPVPGKGQFVDRVENAVTLQMCGLNSKRRPMTIPTMFTNACNKYKNRFALGKVQ
ncbi:hypothetical protein PoB_004004000 [Plakobranchus ocellatus]|uniref:Uncharacterized protein n=1 Tax=Plakobranchus ocellatus TaxID=259542 RepID=A0AAV4B1R5_9GAST|nr:hypothetical protein PoB_004004000 [Plakobranchus ocellatus]